MTNDSDPTGRPRLNRVLLKLSGESLCESGGFGIDPKPLAKIAREVGKVHDAGVQVAVVIGGGNIIRGAKLAQDGLIPQATADQMGMLGTVINGLALTQMLNHLGYAARCMTAVAVGTVTEPFARDRALQHLDDGRIVIFAAGTGHPFFTTDTAAALRAAEIGADALLKATKVDGVYDKDPHQHDDAVRYDRLTYAQALAEELKVMDRTAFALCMDRAVPVIVFSMHEPGQIAAVACGADVGTVVGDL